MGMLTFRERHGITTVLHLTVQAITERDSSELAAQQAIDEIRNIVNETLVTIQRDVYGHESVAAAHGGNLQQLAPVPQPHTGLPSPAGTQKEEADLAMMMMMPPAPVMHTPMDREDGEWSRHPSSSRAPTPRNPIVHNDRALLPPPTPVKQDPYHPQVPYHQSGPLYQVPGQYPVLPNHYAPQPVPRFAVVSLLPKEIQTNIFSLLLLPRNPSRGTSASYRQGAFWPLVCASHVCKQWRDTILHAPALWRVIHSLTVSEMERLDVILSRSAPGPVEYLSLHFVTPRKLDFIVVSNAVARHMHRLVRLELSMSEKQAPVLHALRTALIRTRAPLLEHFTLDYPIRLVLSHGLFERTAPRLRFFSCMFAQLPQHPSDALRDVREFEALDVERPSEERDLYKLLMDLCPRLEKLTLPVPLRDAAEARWDMPLLRSIRVGEPYASRGDRDGSDRLMAPTLWLLRHREVETVHIVAPRKETVQYVMQRFQPREVAVLYGEPVGQLIFRDAHPTQRQTRIFSRVASHILAGALRGIDATRITALSVSCYASRPEWDELFLRVSTLELRSVTQLTILLVPLPLSMTLAQGLVHIFDFSAGLPPATPRRWDFPSLQTLVFTTPASDPAIIQTDNRVLDEVSAIEALRFLRESLVFDALLLPEVILTGGVRFVERYAGPEVEALRRHVGNVVVHG
ncbi:hypothetical protein EXIGLDRAFT_761195 [Exidia glandulosa HHB12029]|uniref:F-box domain-containing protein n=1 Tax=Exidia glandulosa HHB12029 TaxID=1314781 RepID=A0A165NL72_EXIGL|nr:hypothetical protein EXIGLDRAFT_761195 [Exidia glandulosa HHB12029]